MKQQSNYAPELVTLVRSLKSVLRGPNTQPYAGRNKATTLKVHLNIVNLLFSNNCLFEY